MYMSKKQSKRFYECLDSLTLFCNEKFRIAEGLYDQNKNKLNDSKRSKVNEVLWKNPEPIIDEYIEENPFNLSEDLLYEIESWKNALTSRFVVAKLGLGPAVFVCEDIGFGVVGITQEISDLVENVPDIVETTLLPFEGKITFAAQIIQYAIDFGPGMQKIMEEEAQQALSNPLITNKEEFVEQSKILRQRMRDDELENKKKEMQRKYERENNIPVPSGENFHKSVLYGLEGEERKKAKEEYEEKLHIISSKEKIIEKLEKDNTKMREMIKQLYLEFAEKLAINSAPIFSKLEYMNKFLEKDNTVLTKTTQNDHLLGVVESIIKDKVRQKEALKKNDNVDPSSIINEGYESANDAIENAPTEYTNKIEVEYFLEVDNTMFMKYLQILEDENIKFLEKLIHANGYLEFTPEEISTSVIDDIDRVIRDKTYGCLFFDNGIYKVVLFKEILQRMKEIDFSVVRKNQHEVENLLNTVKKMVSVCGVAVPENVYKQWRVWYPDSSFVEDEDELAEVLEYVTNTYDAFENEFDDLYLSDEYPFVYSNLQLSEACSVNDDEMFDNDDFDNLLLDTLLFLLKRHEKIGFKPLSKELRDKSTYEYLDSFPASKRMIRFLEERIPDEESDIGYIKKCRILFYDTIVLSLNPETKINYIIDSDIVKLSNERELEEFLDCLTELSNSLPHCWNNGKSPEEMLYEKNQEKYRANCFELKEGQITKKVIQKVGRNEPCPCGSGKKYKKCCWHKR